MKVPLARTVAIVLLLRFLLSVAHAANDPQKIAYDGDGSDLQKVLDGAGPGAIVTCNARRKLEFSAPLVVKKSLTLRGIQAAVPRGLGKTSLIVVAAEGVTICDSEFHGNYDSVSQKERAPLIWFQASSFTVERCTFHDGSKDGINVTPVEDEKGRDIVGGTIRDIKAYRMGRDAVSISGGNQGRRVRNVTVEPRGSDMDRRNDEARDAPGET